VWMRVGYTLPPAGAGVPCGRASLLTHPGKIMVHHLSKLAFAGVVAAAVPAAAVETITSAFDDGPDGWVGPQGLFGQTEVDGNTGSPAPSFRTEFTDFGITFRNGGPAWAGDYTRAPFAFSVDVESTLIAGGGFIPGLIVRDFVLELRDYDNPAEGYPYTAVWYDLADIETGQVTPTGGIGQSGFVTLTTLVPDPTSSELPPGWRGAGFENENFEPVLPPGRTFADVLAGVDEVALTTLTPGFFFTSNEYNVAIDNPTLTFIPEPTATLAAVAAGGLALRRRR